MTAPQHPNYDPLDDIEDGQQMSGQDMLRHLAEYAQKTVEAIDADPELNQESSDLADLLREEAQSGQ